MSRYLLPALRVFMGGVFILAAWPKLQQPWAMFAMTVDAYGLLPQWAVILVARTLPWAELALALWLISGLWLRFSAAAASAILLGFFTVLVRSYLKGFQIDCGCFGGGDPISPRTLLRDGILLTLSLALLVLAIRQRKSASLDPARQAP